MNRRTFFKLFAGVVAAAAALPFIPKVQAKNITASEVLARRGAGRDYVVSVHNQGDAAWTRLVEGRDYSARQGESSLVEFNIKRPVSSIRIQHVAGTDTLEGVRFEMYGFAGTDKVKFVARS